MFCYFYGRQIMLTSQGDPNNNIYFIVILYVKGGDYLSLLGEYFNIIDPATPGDYKMLTEPTVSDDQRRQLSTMVLNSLLLDPEESEIKTCCPRSLVEWQRGRGIPTHYPSVCSRPNITAKNIVRIADPEWEWESFNAEMIEKNIDLLSPFPKVSS